jgi:hypothetical protein
MGWFSGIQATIASGITVMVAIAHPQGLAIAGAEKSPGMDFTPAEPAALSFSKTPLVAESEMPKIEIIADGDRLRGQWHGETHTIDASELTVRILNTVDPQTYEPVDARDMSGNRIISASVDSTTGNIALGVTLAQFADVDTSAVFIIDPQPGGYGIYRVQVPGERPLPDEFSTNALSSIEYVKFVEGDLLVKQFDMSGSEALVVFTPSDTPAMEYAGCMNLQAGEGRICLNE